MSEYTNVERPFLDKLRQLGWEVIDHGTGFTPQNSAVSRRTSFREIILEQGSEAPRPQGGASKKPAEGDCIPLAPAPHSSPSTGRGILREGIHKGDLLRGYAEIW